MMPMMLLLFMCFVAHLHAQVLLVSKKVDTHGTHIGEYEFVAINHEKNCGPNSNCYGWSVTGNYLVKTYKNETSFFSMEAQITAMRPFTAGSQYTIDFNFPFKQDESKSVAQGKDPNDQVSQLLLTRKFSSWAAKSLQYSGNLNEISKASSRMSALADVDGHWTNAQFELKGDREIEMKVSKWFDQNDDTRDWKLNTVRKWSVGFSDKWFGMQVTSGVLDLPLDSGY